MSIFRIYLTATWIRRFFIAGFIAIIASLVAVNDLGIRLVIGVMGIALCWSILRDLIRAVTMASLLAVDGQLEHLEDELTPLEDALHTQSDDQAFQG